jgi:two-component system, sporulation sensor kinase E
VKLAAEISILNGLPDPVFFVDRSGRVVYLNRACEAAFGLAAESVRQHDLSELLSSELDEGLKALLSPTSGEPAAASLVSVKIGKGFWDVRLTPASDGVIAVHCVPSTGDAAGWPELVADSADAIWAVDADERIVAWNRGAEELFGYSAEEIVGESVERLIPEDLLAEREPERLRKALRELGSVRDYQTRRLKKDGSEVEVSLTSTLARNGSSNNLAASTIVRDLSQRRQMERQVIESEKLVTLGQLASSVAQEIGAPLTTIGIILENLKKSHAGDADVERQVVTAAEQLNRIARLTHGLVELAKPGELNLELVHVRDVVDRVLELLGASLKHANVHVEVQAPEHLPRVLADAGQLQQVFLNLLMNAQRALQSKGGGAVRIRAQLTRGLPVIGRPLRQVIKFEVTDDGPGIEPTDLHYVFAPFFSRSGGSGLGLALAKQIIHAHGGAIEATSTLGNGAIFTILLPVESDA